MDDLEKYLTPHSASSAPYTWALPGAYWGLSLVHLCLKGTDRDLHVVGRSLKEGLLSLPESGVVYPLPDHFPRLWWRVLRQPYPSQQELLQCRPTFWCVLPSCWFMHLAFSAL